MRPGHDNRELVLFEIGIERYVSDVNRMPLDACRYLLPTHRRCFN